MDRGKHVRLCISLMSLAAVSCARDHRDGEDDPRCRPRDAGARAASEAPSSSEPAVAIDEPGSAIGGFCDGSSEIKLVVSTRQRAGSVAAFAITHHYGWPILVVDGHCRYYVVNEVMESLKEGQLTAEELEQLTRDLAADGLLGLPSSRDACADHYDETVIATQTQSLRCACGECTREDATAAMAEARKWIERLGASGTPSLGPLRAFARLGEPVEHEPPWRTQEALSWPLAEPMDGIPDLVVTAWQRPGARFDGADAAALRKIRERSRGMRVVEDYTPLASYVSDCGQTYQLELRDEFPAVIEQHLDAFLARAWSRPKLVRCRDWTGLSGITDVACSDD